MATDADLDSWRSTLALVHTRIKEALTGQDSLNALRYAQTGNFAQQNVLLLEGRPTEIIGGLPEHQSQLTAILARFERTEGRRLLPASAFKELPAVTVRDPSAARAGLDASSVEQTERSFSAPGPQRRRYKGRKDTWPATPATLPPANPD